MLTRRQFTAGAVTLTAGSVLAAAAERPRYATKLAPPAEVGPGKTVRVQLTAAERPTALSCFGRPLPMWTFTEGAWPPVVRLNLGDELQATLENRLPRADESTSIHWHGIRLPNDQDGVPHLVQPPVNVGETFHYRFTPPDCGTYFFHTHCNTVEQLGRGLQGTLIIDGDAVDSYDADVVLLMRDWVIDPDTGQFASFFTLRGAGRAGTYGSLRTVNGMVNPEILLPAAGDCRLRLINSDPTRIMKIGVKGAEAAIIAVDGIAVAPFPLSLWEMGPAMRIDLALRAPPDGGRASLFDISQSASAPRELAHLKGQGVARRTSKFDPAPLRASRIPEPDLNNAMRFNFTFDATDDGQALLETTDALGVSLSSLCLSVTTFWTINERAWPDQKNPKLPAPFALLDRGASYVFRMTNKSQFSHPIHIHGHTFKLLGSNKQSLPTHHMDTLLLLPEETAEVAFVADNPGDWMFHCHVIEHQETGMMGYFRVA
jgi:FtsP/CotA-like multicopper oxidase with cupredoxin domain